MVYPTVYKHRMKSTAVAGWTILCVWVFSTFVALLRLQFKNFNYAMFVVTLSFLYTLVDNSCILWEYLPRGQLPRKMDWVSVDGDQTGTNSFDRDWCVYSLLGAVFHP